jgi:hypothetical protein
MKKPASLGGKTGVTSNAVLCMMRGRRLFLEGLRTMMPAGFLALPSSAAPSHPHCGQWLTLKYGDDSCGSASDFHGIPFTNIIL